VYFLLHDFIVKAATADFFGTKPTQPNPTDESPMALGAFI
jgi:hypothetical protein